MKKVLIISYFFPPGNFAGSYRIKSWAEYLHKFGYYPIIVTRHWAENETDFTAISSKKNIEKEVNDRYTVFRLPYKGTFRDRLVKRFGDKAKIAGKFFSFFQILGQNLFLRSCSYSNLYFFARNYLKDHPEIKLVIASGTPFIQFRFCSLLKKEFPGIKWIADYRDEWNSQPEMYHQNRPLLKRFLSQIEKTFERKWIRSAALVTTVSDEIRNQIIDFNDYKGKSAVVLNGYDAQDFKGFEWMSMPLNKKFRLLHSGTLYPFQDLAVFARGFEKFIKLNNVAEDVELVFSGLNIDGLNKKRIDTLFRETVQFVKILPRLRKQDFFGEMHKSHVLLIFPYNSLNGCFSSKVFEYLPTGRPILLSPSDGNIITCLIKETNTGFVANTVDEVSEFLYNKYLEFRDGKYLLNKGNERVDYYSRAKQTEILAGELDKLTDLKTSK